MEHTSDVVTVSEDLNQAIDFMVNAISSKEMPSVLPSNAILARAIKELAGTMTPREFMLKVIDNPHFLYARATQVQANIKTVPGQAESFAPSLN